MTALPWSTKCVKYLLFIFNLLFVITGIILISVGATIHGVYGSYSQFLDNSGYMSTSAFLVAIGMIIFFISFFGCCGAVKENFCMTISFTALLILVFIFELSAGISGYVLKDNTEEIIEYNLNKTMANYMNNKESQVTIDFIQKNFECCGTNNASSWSNFFPQNESVPVELPISCCNTTGVVGNFSCIIDDPKKYYPRGCISAFGSFISSHAVTIGGVGIGIAFVQLLGIMFSCHLSKQIKHYQTV